MHELRTAETAQRLGTNLHIARLHGTHGLCQAQIDRHSYQWESGTPLCPVCVERWVSNEEWVWENSKRIALARERLKAGALPVGHDGKPLPGCPLPFTFWAPDRVRMYEHASFWHSLHFNHPGVNSGITQWTRHGLVMASFYQWGLGRPYEPDWGTDDRMDDVRYLKPWELGDAK